MKPPKRTRLEFAVVFTEKFPAPDDEGLRIYVREAIKEAIADKFKTNLIQIEYIEELRHLDDPIKKEITNEQRI